MKEATLEERAIQATDAVTKYLKETRLVRLRTSTINYTFDYIPVKEDKE